MNIYLSGMGGTALAPLGNLALDAGLKVFGSDPHPNSATEELVARGASFSTDQSGQNLAAVQAQHPIDWLIYTSALPKDHPELRVAQELGIKATKRDQFIPGFIKDHNFKLIAIAGTHGKTTTTTMAIWLFEQLGLPVSYLVGSSLPFGPAGKYDSHSQYFIYECDEYDRNFLHYQPDFTLAPNIDFDHPDIFPTPEVYRQAFADFFRQSGPVWLWAENYYPEFKDLANLQVLDQPNLELTIIGTHNRRNASLIVALMAEIFPDIPTSRVIAILNQTPFAGRRFEALRPNLISDYAHHPTEIKATIELAHEYAQRQGLGQVVVVYQPHQNTRQWQIKAAYHQAFAAADQILWLATYLTREDPTLAILSPAELYAGLKQAQTQEMNSELLETIAKHLAANDLVVCMSAGTLDEWLRANLPALKG